MTKRTWLADKLERTGASALLLALRGWRRANWLPVLTFHRVRVDQAEPSAFDDEVYDVTRTALDRELTEIREHFEPIGLADLVRFVDGEPLPKRPILITFDDGYRDNVELALPVLAYHRVRATFFIATHYVDERRMFWWDRISYLVKSAQRERIALAYPTTRTFGVSGPTERARTLGELFHLVKTVFDLDLPRFLDELADACGVAWTPAIERGHADDHVMTWDHVRALRAAGMDIASHTHTHRVLHTLRADALARELAESRRILERELGETVTAVSYPVGYDFSARADLRALVRAAGYRLGFTNGTGAQPLHHDFDPYAVRRISTDLDTPASLFRAMLAAPAVFARPRTRRG